MIYLDYLKEATEGTLWQPGNETTWTGFSHDTRQLVPGEMFVAVRGARGNGHDFLLDALRHGATGLLVERHALQHLPEQTLTGLAQSDVTIVEVEDTRLALQQYARAILRRWQPTVIAVTGSVGKTSTKEAIATVLSTRYPTFRSWQNYNDRLGIPLSLGRLEEEHRFAVLELGCDHPGEIADLCQMVKPDIGVLTNIQPVQLQFFGSLDRLANELSTLLNNLPASGHFFYQQNDKTLRQLADEYKKNQPLDGTGETGVKLHPFAAPLADGRAGADCTHVGWDGITGILRSMWGRRKSEQSTWTETTLTAHLLGEHHLATILAAYQVALTLGMEKAEILQALSTLAPLPGRLNPLPGIRNARLLDDTHNASPAAVIAGLRTLHRLTPSGGRRIAVLGEMSSLGSYEEEAHRSVGRAAAELVDYLVTRGEQATMIAEAALQAGLPGTHVIMTANHEDAAQAVRTILESPAREESLNAREVAEKPYDVVLIKGSEETRMERVTELLMARTWEASEKLVRQSPGWKKTIFTHADRPTWVEIDLNAVASNTRHLKSLVGPHVRILVALKADAYGHGALKIARTVLHNGASMLGVATLSEAVPLREARIHAPILIFGYVPPWQMREAIRLQTTITLYSREAAQELSQAARDLEKTVKVHVKVDTGMGRLGIRHEKSDEIIGLVRAIKALPGLELEGIYTHFAQADAAERDYTEQQLARFQHIIALLEEHELRPPLVHAANSAGTLTMPAAHFDMVRPGIAIYGLHPSPDVPLPESFRPALSFKTQVSQVKWVPTGEGISYGSTYFTTRPTYIATLPVGYADGFRRGPRNWQSVLIHGQEAPILGRVCMDQCMIDVTHIPHVRTGDEVVLIGHQGEARLTAEQVADRLGTINYEVVSEILARVPRVD